MRLLLAALLLAHGAAMGQTFACQYTASGGLYWEKGRWEATRFKVSPPFFLRIYSGQMDKDSVDKVLTPYLPESLRPAATGIPSTISCSKRTVYLSEKRRGDEHICTEFGGAVIAFRPALSGGAVAFLGGGLNEAENQYRDGISASPFTCQQM